MENQKEDQLSQDTSELTEEEKFLQEWLTMPYSYDRAGEIFVMPYGKPNKDTKSSSENQQK